MGNDHRQDEDSIGLDVDENEEEDMHHVDMVDMGVLVGSLQVGVVMQKSMGCYYCCCCCVVKMKNDVGAEQKKKKRCNEHHYASSPHDVLQLHTPPTPQGYHMASSTLQDPHDVT